MELALRKESTVTLVEANPLTGRVLVKWLPSQKAPAIQALILAALETGPVSTAVYQKRRPAPECKVRKLINKLILGGIKLTMVLFSRMVWGVAGGPLAIPITILSITGTIITGFDFLRSFYRTATGQSGITTGTLIGAATLSSIALSENFTALIVIWLLNLGEYLEECIIHNILDVKVQD